MSYDENEECFKFQDSMDFEFIAIKWTEFLDKDINCFAAIQSNVAFFISKGHYTCSGNLFLRFFAVANSHNKYSLEIIEEEWGNKII